jgi:hypothetical protein
LIFRADRSKPVVWRRPTSDPAHWRNAAGLRSAM